MSKSYPLLCGYPLLALGWFRILGVGLHWKDTRKHGLTFSQRIGKEPMWRVGWFAVGVLS